MYFPIGEQLQTASAAYLIRETMTNILQLKSQTEERTATTNLVQQSSSFIHTF